LTPSGRFETNTKVCLSFSAFHPELWQPAWGIRLILEALISFLPTPADGAIGALDWSKEERQRLAKLSRSYCCPTCGKCSELLPELKEEHTNGAKKKPSTTRFAKEIAELQRLQLAADRKKKSPAEDMATESQDETKTEPPKAGKETTDGAPEIAAATSAESINQEAPEEEIVFDTPSPMASPATISTQLAEERAEEEKGQSAAATPATENTMPDMGEQVQAQINNNNAMPILEDDPSWMYDPLLNLMMVLLAVICYLLIQKYQVLMEELYELQHMSDF
jgi:ubiquitin-conjugating enzyme E2 J1